MSASGCNEDFTEDHYRALLRLARAQWGFVSFAEFNRPGRVLLWRHDVDISMHRALRLAEIEHEEGVKSTFFVMLHSSFYNLLEHAVVRRVESILALGHDIGLHFDPLFYGDKIKSKDQLIGFLEREKAILEDCFGVPIAAFSWHNPTVGNWLSMDDHHCGGMVNAYGTSVHSKFTYVSDSNGIWRHKRLQEVLENGEDPRLHVLTHPEWWQATAMSPRERVFRSVEGRALAVMRQNDALLAEYGRENLGGGADNLKFLKEIDTDYYQLCDYLWNSLMHRSLFIELYRLHERQIKQLCKWMFCKVWRVPVCDVDAFFKSGTLAVDGWKLFEAVFEISWVGASGCSEDEHKDWVKVGDQLFYESAHISSDKIEEGCVYLCSVIESTANWGRAQEMIEYDGITCLSKLVEQVKEDGSEVGLSHSKKWEEFKLSIQEIQKG